MLCENNLVRAGSVLGVVIILMMSLFCTPGVALADVELHWENEGGTSAILHDNGTITGTCYVDTSISDPNGDGTSENFTYVAVTMPDTQVIQPYGNVEDACATPNSPATRDGYYPFTATPISGEADWYSVYVEGSIRNYQDIYHLRWHVTTVGYGTVTKRSSNPIVTNNNSSYGRLEDAVFTVYKGSTSQGTIRYRSGAWTKLELADGTYTMRETTVPSGYKTPNPNSKSFDVKSGETTTVSWVNEPYIPKTYVTKTGTTGVAAVDALIAANFADYDLSGAEFTLYKSKNTNDRAVNASGDTFVLRVTKQADGTYVTNTVQMPAGTYYVRETRAPNKGYERDTDGDGIADVDDPNPTDYWYSITLPADDQVHPITWNDKPKMPKVRVNKTGTTGDDWLDERVSNNPYYDLAGAEFTLYTSKNMTEAARAINSNGQKFTLKVTRQSDGTYKTNEAQVVAGTYYVRETKAPNSGYQIDTDGDGICDNEDPNPTDYWYSITLPADEQVHSISWNDPPFFPEVDLTKYTDKKDMDLFEAVKDNPCYDILGAQFTLYETTGDVTLDINGAPVVFTVNSSEEHGTVGITNKFKILPGDYWLRETRAPNKGFRLDADGDGVPDEIDRNGTDGHKDITVGLADQTFTWVNDPMIDPDMIFLVKYDSVTGRYFKVPEGDADLNGAQYRISYYKGIYTRADQLPATPDATAVWTTRTGVHPDGTVSSGIIDFAVDAPSSGTWKYNRNGDNYAPLGTLVLEEVAPPEGYLIDSTKRIVTSSDDGSHYNLRVVNTPYNQDGTPGNDDWNYFANQYQLNGDRSGIETRL